MATRTRTRGNLSTLYITGTVKTRRMSDGVIYSTGSVQTLTVPGLPYETMTDTKDAPRVNHNVSHTKVSAAQEPGTWIECKGFPYYTGTLNGLAQKEYKFWLPYSSQLPTRSNHIIDLSGVKALAIARVPAYSKANVEGFISLMEARELVNSTAIKSAAALGRFAKMAYYAATTGGRKNLVREVSRDAKRALGQLAAKRKSLSSAKELFHTVLDGVSFGSNLDMEWKYGVAPMLDDIQKANAAVIKLGQIKQRLLDGVRVYGRAVDVRQDSNVLSLDFVTSSNGGVGPFICSYTRKTKRTAVASIVRRLNPNNPMYDCDWFTSLDCVQEVNGLNPSAKRAWQLLPMSFIVDWFWNAGSLLESLETLASPVGANFTSSGGLYSEKTETTITGSGFCANAMEPTSFPWGGTRTTYTRNSDPLTGGPTLYIPPLTLPTKAGQWWSMAQIAFQRMLATRRR